MSHPNLDAETAWDFLAYSDVAEELEAGQSLDDQDQRYVACARRAATRLSLSWPPDMLDAEAFRLGNGTEIGRFIDLAIDLSRPQEVTPDEQ